MIWVIIIPVVLVTLVIKLGKFADEALAENAFKRAEFKAKYKEE